MPLSDEARHMAVNFAKLADPPRRPPVKVKVVMMAKKAPNTHIFQQGSTKYDFQIGGEFQ
jgi:hypothetical protein